MELTVLFLILLAVLAAVVFTLQSFFRFTRDRVPFVTTPQWVIEWLVQHADIPENAVVVDLGCGDGRVLAALKKTRPDIRAIGYDQNWWANALARVRHRNIQVRNQNFFYADLSKADVVYCYLMHPVMANVAALLKKQLKPGALVYSYAFQLPGWKTEQTIAPLHPGASNLHIYRA